ncbi:MAG: SPASM domain-containing protein, partial [Anaerolineae bacterium]
LRAMMQRRYTHNPDDKPPPEPPPLTEEMKQDIHPCGAGQTSCCIDSYGNVHPCAAIDTVLGNLRKERFADIWHNSEELERIRSIRLSDLPECGSCDLFLPCNRCAGLAKMETGSLLGRPSQCCEVTYAMEGFYREKRCELF